MKKLALLALASIMSISMVACSKTQTTTTPPGDAAPGATQNANVKTTTLRMAFNQAESHPQYRAMQAFSDNFKAATNGKYEIKLFPNETLGNQRESLEQCQAGTIDLTIVNNTHPGSVSDYFKAFDLPFVFEDIPDAIDFMTTDPVMDEVKGSVESSGIKIAAYFPAGVRSMYTSKKPISNVADMKGLKIRTMESNVYIRMMELLGANATPMAMGELYTAIQSGVVDGAENNEITYVTAKHYEAAPYWSQTNHLIVPDWLIINKALYDGFTDEEKAAFDAECIKAASTVNELWDKDVDELMASLADKNVTITSDVDIQSFKDAVQPLYQEITGSNDKIKKVYDAILAH